MQSALLWEETLQGLRNSFFVQVRMKVLLVNASDAKGGAAIVARRLLHALNAQEGVEAKMLVAEKTTDDPDVIALFRRWWLKKALDRMVVWAANGFTMKGLWWVDGGFFGNDITQRKEFKEADVIHLHWVNQGFLGMKDIQHILHSGKKVVWTMHDMWASTAMCHHSGDCTQFKEAGCKHCPQLQRTSTNNLVERVWQQKQTIYKDSGLQLIACSSWMAQKAKDSVITRDIPVTVIPNVFEVEGNYRKSLEPTKKRILFSAARIDTELKGFDDLVAALHHLSHRSDIELLLVGGINDQSILRQIPIPYTYLGYQRDMLSVYASADCVINCSRFETLPTTIVEAQAVGTTPVAYEHSGATDLIVNGVTGYFAEYRNPISLANAIENAIDHPLSAESLIQHVRESYSADIIAQRHLQIYK